MKSLGQNFCALPTLPFSHCRMRCSVATCVSAAATNNFLVSAQKGRNERAQKGEFPFTVIISDKVADRAENIHGDDEGARFVTREGGPRPERSGLSASGVVSYGLRIGASKHCSLLPPLHLRAPNRDLNTAPLLLQVERPITDGRRRSLTE